MAGWFSVEPEIFERFPGMHIPVAVATGLRNDVMHDAVAASWRAAWSGAAEAAVHRNAQSHPRIVPWRERFRVMGVSGKEFPSSAEALLRRAMKGGEPFTINPLVDFYNAISLRHVCPAGGFDLAALTDGLELRLTRDGDAFTSLDTDAPLALPPGEVAYATGSTILTRHFVWRQSREGLVARDTHDLILLSEVLGEVGAEVGELVLDDFRTGLEDWFGVTPQTFMVSAGQTRVSW